jgi:cytochrome c peroxidase
MHHTHIKWLLAMLAMGLLLAVAVPKQADEQLAKLYATRLQAFEIAQMQLQATIASTELSETGKASLITEIAHCRRKLKALDFWLRYFEPIAYKQINGPLPVEWETEVFEKWEKPYRREGAGLTLAALYLEEEGAQKGSLLELIRKSTHALATYKADSITVQLAEHHHFFLCNRLFLLNLATIYTTGFECPLPTKVIPELRDMLIDVGDIYVAYNHSFPQYPLTAAYRQLYQATIAYVVAQPQDLASFDHFGFLRDYVNPLFALNQQMIQTYGVVSASNADYSLAAQPLSIFDKALFFAQNPKGVYARVKDEAVLQSIDSLGKLLFYDPILSGNNQRSCVSCHQPTQFFTDTLAQTALQYDPAHRLARNTPSLLNVMFNHLIMLDGKLLDLQAQAHTVITNPIELGGVENDILAKILSCNVYKSTLKKLLAFTPQYDRVTFDHVISAITLYYSKFSRARAPFDAAIDKVKPMPAAAMQGYNLFMGKAQCGTCHFSPTFSGIKPPYIGNEFEVIGSPSDTNYLALSADRGRFDVHAAPETMNAFRTPTLRNVVHTAPYMHNGSFKTLEQVLAFYDHGGGLGHHLAVPNQTLSADSLHLTPAEKQQLIAFMDALTEDIPFEKPPKALPTSSARTLNARKVGGEY